MSNIDASQFENKIEQELETALPSDLASKENAMDIADTLFQFAEKALGEMRKNILFPDTNQTTNVINTFGTNPQGSHSSTGKPRQEGNQEQTLSDQDTAADTPVEPENTVRDEDTQTAENQETIPSSETVGQENTPQESSAPTESIPEEVAPEPTEDSLGFTNPADHPATDEQTDNNNTAQKQEDTPETRGGEEQKRARQLAAQQQAARSQQQVQSAKNQEINVLTTKRSQLLKKAGAMALKGSPILRIMLGVSDTLDVAEFEDGAILSALTSPLIFTAQVYFYIFQNSETKRHIAEKYMKKGILLAAMEMIPFINILPWDTINSGSLARSVKKEKEGYNKEAADIATTIKKIESNQNH